MAPKTCSFKRFSNVRNTRCSNSFSLDSKSRLDLAKTYINSKRFLNFTRFMSHIFFIRLTRVPSTLIVFHPSRHTCTHEPRTHTRFHAHTLSRTHTLACTHTPTARKHASMRGCRGELLSASHLRRDPYLLPFTPSPFSSLLLLINDSTFWGQTFSPSR